ncbi:MAG: glycosyltransferase [Cyanobacteriota bacterium]
MASPVSQAPAQFWYAEGQAALASGEMLRAEQALWECIALMPDHGAALHLLGRIRARQGRLRDALALQQRSLAVAPLLGWNAFAVGELHDQQRQWTEALQAFRRAAQCLPRESWIGRRCRQAEGLAVLGGGRLADGLSPAAYAYWCRELEPPPPPALTPPGSTALPQSLAGWWLDPGVGVRLRPGAARWIGRWLETHAGRGADDQADLLYCDEDLLDPTGVRSRPWFKPQWHDETFWATPWLDSLALWRRDWLQAHGLTPPPPPRSSCLERWQWQLQALLLRPRAFHLPRLLVHRSVEDPEAPCHQDLQQRKAEGLRLHLQQRQEPAVAVVSPHDHGFRLIWATPASTRVSLIVCTRDRPDLLGQCLSSIEGSLRRQEASQAVEWDWLVVDNGSRLQATAELLSQWRERPGTRLRTIDIDAPFNWSVLNNQAAAQASGDALLLLNNDVRATAMTAPHWLAAMAAMALRPQIGAVGACLLDPGGRLQHAGLIPSMGAGCEHPYRQLRPDHDVHRGRSRFLTVWPAVTGACLAVRRRLFRGLGGLCPDLPVEGNDVDLCLRLGHHGLRQVVVPEAVLEHQEGSSRGIRAGASASWQEAMELLRRRWPAAFVGPDPCWPSASGLTNTDGRPAEFEPLGWL